MITDGNKWHYFAISSLSALLEGKLSNHDGYFYCLNCFNSYTEKNRLKEHEKICNKHDSCRIEMPKWFENNIKIQSWRKIIKTLICNLSWSRMFIKKKNNLVKTIPKNLTKRKKATHEPLGWAVLTKCLFDKTEDKFDYWK